MNYEEQNKEFTAWFEEQTQEDNEWTILERLAAHDAWMEAHKRALNLYNVVGQNEQLFCEECCNEGGTFGTFGWQKCSKGCEIP